MPDKSKKQPQQRHTAPNNTKNGARRAAASHDAQPPQKTQKSQRPQKSQKSQRPQKPQRPQRHHPAPHWWRRLPGWAWWTGGLLMAALYVWLFYRIFVSPYGLRWRHLFSGDVTYPTGYDIHGIDVSHHQGAIDWELLCNQGTIDDCPIRFVFIKATEGASQRDPMFQRNFSEARRYGFTRGAYHYFSTQSAAEDQARNFVNTVTLEPGDLPPVLDVETKPTERSNADFRRDVLLWLHTVEQHYGVKPILYTYHRFRQDYLNDSIFDDYPYWIAHYYVDSVQYAGKWKFWQHTDAGHLPGIKGEVDFNIYNGSYYDLQQMTLK